MRTRSSSNLPVVSSNPSTSNPKRPSRRRSKQPFILEESPIDTMAYQRTMAELLRAPTKGYAEAIVDNPHDHIRWLNKITSTIKYKDVPNSAIKLMLFPFSLAWAVRRWLEKEPSRSIHTWEDLVSKFINEFFPPSRTTNLRNEISNFQQRFDESFHEAWDRYKDLLRACPHHGFTELHQLDTFYTALNPSDQDSLNAAAGGNLLERRTQDVLTIIKNKSKCLVADGNTFPELRDNIQGYVLAAAVNYNQGNFVYRPLGLPELISTPMTLELANRAICTLAGIARDVFVPVSKFTFLADFVIVDYKSDPRVPLILGRPFLRTARALIDVHGEEMILHDEVESDTENVYDDPFDSKGEKIKESKLLIDELDLVCDFLPSFDIPRNLKTHGEGFCPPVFISSASLGNHPSNDNPNVVNALREPFVVNQDPGKNSSQSPPQINHHCCYGCGDPLEGIFCHQCTCKLCGNGAHYGYNCPLKVSIIPNLELFNNQTIKELPPTVQNVDPKSDLDSPNVFDPPPQLSFYSFEFCGNDARYGHYCTPQVPFVCPVPCYNQDFNFLQEFQDFQQQDICCENCRVTHKAYQCQPKNADYYQEQNSCYDHNSFGFDQFQTQQYTVNHPIFNSQKDLFDSQNKLMEQLASMCDMVSQFIQKKEEEKQFEDEQATNARYWKTHVCYNDDDDDYTFAITPNEPDNSLSTGDEHLDTIPEKESDEFIKSSVENLIPNPSEFGAEHECDVPVCEGFTTFSNILFDADYDFYSVDIDPHHFNVESDLIESLLNHDSSIISSSSKIDFLFDEFAGELTFLKSIPPGIDETDYDPEEEIRLIEDSDSLMEEIDLSFTPDYPMPPGIEKMTMTLKDGNTGILNVKLMGNMSEQKVPMPRLMITLVLNQEKSPDLLSLQGHEAFQPFSKCTMMIHGKNTPILDVLLFHFYPR
nr:reverse transcriptase domain-containing protein [Tanacetum cinerariifolium]